MPRITAVRSAWLQAPIPPEQRHTSSFGLMDTFNSGLVTVETDDGLTGYGEAKVHVGSAGNYAAVCAVVEHELRPLLLGEDPRAVSGLWQKMYNGSRAGTLASTAARFRCSAGAALPSAPFPGWTSLSGTCSANGWTCPCTSSSAAAAGTGSRPMRAAVGRAPGRSGRKEAATWSWVTAP